MKIKWYGHSSFLITSNDGTKIITDPYEPQCYDGAIGYGAINDIADIAVSSHDHADHGYIKGLKGSPEVVTKEGEIRIKGVTIKGMKAYHDEEKGSQRGAIVIFKFLVDGISICHLGDLGEMLADEQIKELKPVDILLIPVGGVFTIDSKSATNLIAMLNPRIIIPMHYKTEKCGFPLSEVDEFLKGKKNIKKTGTSEIEFTKASLPAEPEIIVLEYAL